MDTPYRNRPVVRRRRKRVNRFALRGYIKMFLLFCLCLLVAFWVIGLLGKDAPRNGAAPAAGSPPARTIAGDPAIDDALSTAGTAADESLTAAERDWNLVLVNKWNPMRENFSGELEALSNGQSVDKRIYPALAEMLTAAENAGVYATVVSGYRTEDEQRRLFDEKVLEYVNEDCSVEEAEELAAAWVALPGASEHQLGIAVDINADGVNSTGAEVYEWLERNSYTFGFIRRYSADKTGLTGVTGEPWHYRYVGVKAATDMYRWGICLEEYLLL